MLRRTFTLFQPKNVIHFLAHFKLRQKSIPYFRPDRGSMYTENASAVVNISEDLQIMEQVLSSKNEML